MSLDVSGSMWGQIEGEAKIVIARNAVRSLVANWPDSRKVGVIAYGHRRKGDCSDIETVVPFGVLDKDKLVSVVDSLTPRGMTPLSASVRLAAEELKYTEQKATVILISDGIENCDLDPCKVGEDLENLGIDFTAHVIGFDLPDAKDQEGLRCLAANTGGLFLVANNADELNEALEKTTQVVPVEPAPIPVEPTPTPVPVREGKVFAPESAIKGTEIELSFEAEEDLGGYVYLYPKGRDTSLVYSRVRMNDQGTYDVSTLRLPAETGLYTVRWESNQREILGEVEVEAIEAEIELLAPDEAVSGTEIEVSLKAPEGLSGYLYLYPVGRDKHLSYSPVRQADLGGYQVTKLRLPAQPGEYLVRWESSKREHLAETLVTGTAAETSLDVPEEATAGTLVSVTLIAPEGLDGYIYLYATGRDKHLSYVPVRAESMGGYQNASLRMPATPGNYTIRWEDRQKVVLAEAQIELLGADLSIEHEEEAPIASELQVRLVGPDGLDGYVYLYPAGRDRHITYTPIREARMGGYEVARLRLPAVAGDYEIKWESRQKETLAEGKLRIVEVDIQLNVPAEALKSTRLQVTVEAPAKISGYLYLYKKGIEKEITYQPVREGRLSNYEPANINLPESPGEYEIKFISRDKEILTEASFSVVEEFSNENSAELMSSTEENIEDILSEDLVESESLKSEEVEEDPDAEGENSEVREVDTADSL